MSAKDNAEKRRISAFELLFDLVPDALEVLKICAPATTQRPACQRDRALLGEAHDCSTV
jgi:hypothetical protein